MPICPGGPEGPGIEEATGPAPAPPPPCSIQALSRLIDDCRATTSELSWNISFSVAPAVKAASPLEATTKASVDASCGLVGSARLIALKLAKFKFDCIGILPSANKMLAGLTLPIALS